MIAPVAGDSLAVHLDAIAVVAAYFYLYALVAERFVIAVPAYGERIRGETVGRSLVFPVESDARVCALHGSLALETLVLEVLANESLLCERCVGEHLFGYVVIDSVIGQDDGLAVVLLQCSRYRHRVIR